jgi:3-phosphoshikimate 1-carboxyvinyltransferase
MTALVIEPVRSFRGTARIPGDKSISHRALIFNSLAHGSARIEGLLKSADVDSTARCLRALGVDIQPEEGGVRVHGRGGLLRAPVEQLDCGNSGTTMRLLCGVLAGQPFDSTVCGDESLERRPMSRVTIPLRAMGAQIDGREAGNLAPLEIRGRRLVGAQLESPIASAQVRSALLLAGLGAEGRTRICQPSWSRDHTERMLSAMGAVVEVAEKDGIEVSIQGGQGLTARDIRVPGDLSSAAFFMVAAAAAEGSEVRLDSVGINPTRTGIIDVLRRMGAEIDILEQRDEGGEPVGDLLIRGRGLQGVRISGHEIPRLIDELPVIAVAASVASGVTTVEDAGELRVKESDRIESTLSMLAAVGASAEGRPDGFAVEGSGGTPLSGGGQIYARGDHRIAMAGIVGASLSAASSRIYGASCMDVSFPGFLGELNRLRCA